MISGFTLVILGLGFTIFMLVSEGLITIWGILLLVSGGITIGSGIRAKKKHAGLLRAREEMEARQNASPAPSSPPPFSPSPGSPANRS